MILIVNKKKYGYLKFFDTIINIRNESFGQILQKIINWAFLCDKPKKGCHLGLHLDSHFIFRSFDSECRGHFDFLLIYRQ